MTLKSELSRPFEAAAVFREGDRSVLIEADPEERRAVAARLGLLDLMILRADITLSPWRSEGILVRGTLSAAFIQSCVVTLDPLPGRLEEPFEARYLPASAFSEGEEEGGVLSDPDAADPPERLPPGGQIDLGELAVQHLAIVLDPYPRKPDAAFAAPEGPAGIGAGIKEQSPFAGLAALKPQRKG